MGGDNNQDPFTNKDLWPRTPIIFVGIGNFALNQMPVPKIVPPNEELVW
jgi:hypothetical protein